MSRSHRIRRESQASAALAIVVLAFAIAFATWIPSSLMMGGWRVALAGLLTLAAHLSALIACRLIGESFRLSRLADEESRRERNRNQPIWPRL